MKHMEVDFAVTVLTECLLLPAVMQSFLFHSGTIPEPPPLPQENTDLGLHRDLALLIGLQWTYFLNITMI